MASPVLTSGLLAFLLCAPAVAHAGDVPAWTLRVRAAVSGVSHSSEPAGYEIYSGVALDAGIERRLGDVFTLAFSLRTESREVDGPAGTGINGRLGSLEMAPLNLLAYWRPLDRGGGTLLPYLGAGVNATFTWEKSGALDSTDVPVAVGPALGCGVDVALQPLMLNVDIKWNTLTVEIEDFGSSVPRIDIDPLTFGLGVGIRF